MSKQTKSATLRQIEDLPVHAEQAGEVKGGSVPDAPDLVMVPAVQCGNPGVLTGMTSPKAR